MSVIVAHLEIKDPTHKKVRVTLDLHQHHMSSNERLGAVVREGVTQALVTALRQESGGIIQMCEGCAGQLTAGLGKGNRKVLVCRNPDCRLYRRERSV